MARDDRADEAGGAALTLPVLLVAAALAFLVTWGGTFVVRRYAPAWGLLDRPNQRSSHVRATPRGGGVGVIAGVMVALGVIHFLVEPLA